MSRSDAAGRGHAEVVVFGRRAVLEALAERAVEVLEVRAAKDAPAPFRKELGAACRERGAASPELTDARGVSALSGEARHDQGVAARVRLTRVMEVDAFARSLTGADAKKPARVIALDGVTNPQNVGMIVRSAAAAGMSAILWPLVGSPWVNGLIVKSSASTIFRFPIVRCHTLSEGLWELKRSGFTLYGLAADGATSLFDCRPAHRGAFIMGGETEGLSRETLDLLDERVSIPMAAGVESLNVAVAAGLVCFHAAR